MDEAFRESELASIFVKLEGCKKNNIFLLVYD